VTQEIARLQATNLSPLNGTAEVLAEFGLESFETGVNALQFLRRPDVSYDLVSALTAAPSPLAPAVSEQVSIEVKYEGYIAKQQQQVERMRRLEDKAIPTDFAYEAIHGLRKEARDKLIRFRPATVGQAGRIAGVNPADISILLVHLEKRVKSPAS
jgi:tRNA uridine 5-carboxymethylaminomethyl modification enzyme